MNRIFLTSDADCTACNGVGRIGEALCPCVRADPAGPLRATIVGGVADVFHEPEDEARIERALQEADVFAFTCDDGDHAEVRVRDGKPEWRWRGVDVDGVWTKWRFAELFDDECIGPEPGWQQAREWCRERGVTEVSNG